MNLFVDIETTGFNVRTDRITRLTAIKAFGYEVVDVYDSLVNPLTRVDPKILKMTSLRQEILDLSPVLPQLIPGFRSFSQNCALIGWGSFEGTWLPHHGLAAKCFNAIPYVKKKIKGKVIDFKLCTVAKFFGVPLRHHDSLSDALAMYNIWNILKLRI